MCAFSVPRRLGTLLAISGLILFYFFDMGYEGSRIPVSLCFGLGLLANYLLRFPIHKGNKAQTEEAKK